MARGWTRYAEFKRWLGSLPSAVEVCLPLDYNGHVAAFSEELHHLLARACHFCPAGFRVRVLLQPSNLCPVENEVQLPQTHSGRPPNAIMPASQLDYLGVVDEDLSPDFDQRLLERKFHGGECELYAGRPTRARKQQKSQKSEAKGDAGSQCGHSALYFRAGLKLGLLLRIRLGRLGGSMELRGIVMAILVLLPAMTVLGQDQAPPLPPAPANAPPPSLQANADPGYDAALAACKNPPRKIPPIRFPATGPAPRDYTVTEIPGVIAAGQKWKFLWQERGNNGDGIVGTKQGGLLIAQNDKSDVVKLDRKGKPSVVYTDTNTGGALSINSKGELFIVERGLHPAIWELAPKRRLLADKYKGDSWDCIPSVLNDLSADGRGGAYFTMGGLFYAGPDGVVTEYGENLFTNGIILSPDEKKLYVTNRNTVVVFDVQPDGSLINQRDFAKLQQGTAGDGSTIDADGRIYVSTNPGVQVIGPDGTWLGLIPTPRDVISVSFGGRDRKTLFILARGAEDSDSTQIANAAQVFSIQTIAHGYQGRPK
jgi:gluconolactonase